MLNRKQRLAALLCRESHPQHADCLHLEKTAPYLPSIHLIVRWFAEIHDGRAVVDEMWVLRRCLPDADQKRGSVVEPRRADKGARLSTERGGRGGSRYTSNKQWVQVVAMDDDRGNDSSNSGDGSDFEMITQTTQPSQTQSQTQPSQSQSQSQSQTQPSQRDGGEASGEQKKGSKPRAQEVRAESSLCWNFSWQ